MGAGSRHSATKLGFRHPAGLTRQRSDHAGGARAHVRARLSGDPICNPVTDVAPSISPYVGERNDCAGKSQVPLIR
jgi:hypothetical protein